MLNPLKTRTTRLAKFALGPPTSLHKLELMIKSAPLLRININGLSRHHRNVQSGVLGPR